MLSEERIKQQLDMLLKSSDPGDSLHHLHVVTSDGKPGPLGPPAESQLETTVYAIMPVGADVDPETFTANVVVRAAMENIEKGRMPVFAALSQEMVTVEAPAGHQGPDPVAEEILARGGSLAEHPAAMEVTVLYAACRDGRRWKGRRYLTGARAGEIEEAELLVGRVRPRESVLSVAPLIRKLVGLTM